MKTIHDGYGASEFQTARDGYSEGDVSHISLAAGNCRRCRRLTPLEIPTRRLPAPRDNYRRRVIFSTQCHLPAITHASEKSRKSERFGPRRI